MCVFTLAVYTFGTGCFSYLTDDSVHSSQDFQLSTYTHSLLRVSFALVVKNKRYRKIKDITLQLYF